MSAQPLDIRLSALEASVEHLNGTYEQIDKRIGDLRTDMHAGFARVDHRLGSIENRFESIDHRFESMDLRFESMDRRFESMDRRFESMDRRFESLDCKIDSNLKTIISWMLGQTAVIVGAIAGVAFTLRH